MHTKTVFQLDANGVFILEDNVFLIPAGCVENAPPPHIDAKLRIFTGDDWQYQDISVPEPQPEILLPTLAQIKTAKWEQIKAERGKLEAGGCKVGTKWYHSDADSRIKQLGLKDKARDLRDAGGAMSDSIVILGQPVKWKTMDGSFMQATAQLAFDIVTAAGELDARIFAAAETHRATMEASADPAVYDFTQGWPAVFAS
jgi:hypothetical protein